MGIVGLLQGLPVVWMGLPVEPVCVILCWG
jgi:hypothetical protein